MPESSPEIVTLGEVNRTVLRLFEKVEDMNKTISGYPRWQDLNRITEAIADRAAAQDRASAASSARNVERIESLEHWNKWAVRTILGALVAAPLSALLVLT